MTTGDELHGWEAVGTTGRFLRVRLPMSEDALELNDGRVRYLIYGEFDTGIEPDAWKAYVYDPLRVLSAEGILDDLGKTRPHLQVDIVKLAGPDSRGAKRIDALRSRGRASHELYESAEISPEVRRSWHVTTAVVSHENALNPRIGMTTVMI